MISVLGFIVICLLVIAIGFVSILLWVLRHMQMLTERLIQKIEEKIKEGKRR